MPLPTGTDPTTVLCYVQLGAALQAQFPGRFASLVCGPLSGVIPQWASTPSQAELTAFSNTVNNWVFTPLILRTINALSTAIFALTGSLPTPSAGTQKANIIANLFSGAQGSQLWELDAGPNAGDMAAIATACMNSNAQYVLNAAQQLVIAALYVQDQPFYLVNPSWDPTINVPGYTS